MLFFNLSTGRRVAPSGIATANLLPPRLRQV